ncbi:MAG TPA: recombinase family protein [Clostridia bacterium]|nr:recombinase family protein [Clostridia bacterium]
MKAAAYARYSSDNQREESIDAQLRAIRAFADRYGYDLVSIYSDEALSGKTDERAQFRAMLSDASKGAFGVVIVHEFSRFARNARDSRVYKTELKQYGIRVVSVLEPLDDSPTGRFMEVVIEGKDQMYSEHLAIETMKGLKENAYNCKFTGGRPPLGYDVVDLKYVINEREALLVRQIFAMYATGHSYEYILKQLVGQRTKGGSAFGKNSLNSLLTNERYVGTFTFNVRSYGAGKKRNPDSEIIRVEDGMPAIIDTETWRLVQARVKANKHNAANRAKHSYLLSGKLVCGGCGAPYVGITSRGGRASKIYAYYLCGKRCGNKGISKESLEQEVVNSIYDEFFCDLNAAADLLYSQQNAGTETEAKKRLQQTRREIENIVDAIAKGAYHERLTERLNGLREEEQQLQEVRSATFTRAEILARLEQFGDIRQASYEVQRRAVLALVDKIVIFDDGTYDIWFCVPLGASPRNQLNNDHPAGWSLFNLLDIQVDLKPRPPLCSKR